VSALLIPVTEEAQRWVPIALAVVCLVLAIASWADRRTKRRGRDQRGSPTAARTAGTTSSR
jgi:hypothetical protein